jgi:ankyrin repeat protein
MTALHWAASNGHEGCVRLLLEAEAIEVNATVSLEHALPQHMRWVRFHIVIPLGLSFVFRATTIGQHCIPRQ